MVADMSTVTILKKYETLFKIICFKLMKMETNVEWDFVYNMHKYLERFNVIFVFLIEIRTMTHSKMYFESWPSG